MFPPKKQKSETIDGGLLNKLYIFLVLCNVHCMSAKPPDIASWAVFFPVVFTANLIVNLPLIAFKPVTHFQSALAFGYCHPSTASKWINLPQVFE